MELTLSKQPVSVMETMYDGTVEQALECDVLLPEHCPDLQKILRCEVSLSLLGWKVQGERAVLEGMAAVHVYYTDEAGCMRHVEYKIPYTKQLELKAEPVRPVVEVSQSMDYFNCRAVSPRRLDMRGAARILCRINGQTEEHVICGAQGNGLQLRQEHMETIRLLPCPPQRMQIHEEMELSHGKPAIGEALRVSVCPKVTDYKVITGKIVLKGEIAVHILYRCEQDPAQLETMEYTMPVSQVVDVEGLEEDCGCSVWMELCDTAVQPKADDAGQNTVFVLDISMNALAQAAKPSMIEAACDCYSTEYECRQEQKQVPFLEYLGPVAESVAMKETVAADNVKSVADLWCVLGSVNVRPEQDTVALSGKLTICMLAYNTNDELMYQEQLADFTHSVPLPQPCDTLLFTPKVTVDNISFSMNGPQPEARCNLSIVGELYGRRAKRLLCGVDLDASRKKERRDNVLYLYYTVGKESLWDVAKRYNTSPEAIQKSNGLEQPAVTEKTMLLIPMQ